MIIAAVDFLSGLVSDKFFSIAKNRSNFGGLCSLLFFVILIIGIERSCSELFSRNNPSTQSSTRMNEDPKDIVITPDLFPLSFYVSYPSALGTIPFKNDSIYTLSVYHMIIGNAELPDGTTTRVLKQQTPLELEECTPEYAGDYAYKFKDYNFHGSHCIKANQGAANFTLAGRFTIDTYQALLVTVKPCNTSAPNNNCAPSPLISQVLTGAWFTVGYFNHLPTLQNYDKPLDYYIDDFTTIISPGMYKHAFVEVGYVEATTDTGYIFESNRKDTSFKVGTTNEYSDPNPSLDGSLMMCLIQSGQEETYYTRSYKKFQSTLSDIGGLANAVLGIILIVATPYLKFKSRENLMNEVFTIKEEPKVVKPKKQKSKPEKKRSNKMQSLSQNSNAASAQKYQEQKGMLSGIGMLSMESQASPTREDFPLRSPHERSLSPLRVKSNEVVLSLSSLNRIPESPKIKKHGFDIKNCGRLVSDETVVPCIGPTEPAKLTQGDEKHDNNDIENQLEYRQRKVEVEDMTDVKFDESPLKTKPDKFSFETAAGPNTNTNNNQSETQSNNPEIKEKNQITLVYKHDNSKTKTRQKQKQKKVHLKFWEYLMSLICKPKSIRHKIETVQAGVDNVHQRLELNNILKKLSEVDKLISLLLDSDQLELFNSIPKPQIYLKQNLPELLRKNSFERKLHHKASLVEGPQDGTNIVKAYNKLKNKEKKTEIDNRLIYIFNETVE